MRRPTIVSGGLLLAVLLADGHAAAVQFVAQAQIPLQPFGTLIVYPVVGADSDTVVTGLQTNGSTFQANIDVRTGTSWSVQRVIPDGTDTVKPTGTIIYAAVSGDTAAFSGGYVYARSGTTWSLQQRIVPNQQALALKGDVLVVGTAVYTRTATTWTEQQILAPPGAASDPDFGWVAALSGNTLALASNANIYLFVQDATGWSLQQIIPAVIIGLALDGDTLALGGLNSAFQGTTTVYVRSGGVWSQQQLLAASDGFQDDGFGESVALAGDTLAVVGNSERSVYVFGRSGGVWSQAQEISRSDMGPRNVVLTPSLTMVVGSGRNEAPWVFVPVPAPSVPALGGRRVPTLLLVVAFCACAWALLARGRRPGARPPTST